VCFRGGLTVLPFPLESAWAAYCYFHLVTFISGLLVLYFPVMISFFLLMSLLLSLLFCVRLPLSMSFSEFRISSERRLVHLVCCHTSFCKVSLRWRHPSPHMAFSVAPLNLSLACGGSASARATFRGEIRFRRLFWVLFLCSFLSPARLRAFYALSCRHLTSLVRISCSF